jgi:hypothetical protein
MKTFFLAMPVSPADIYPNEVQYALILVKNFSTRCQYIYITIIKSHGRARITAAT